MLLLALACSKDDVVPEDEAPVRVGDPDVGWEALRYGGFVGAGVPADVWFELVPPIPSNVLEREGDAAGLPSSFNLFEAPNGVDVVGGITCFGCHAGNVNGEYVPGLGNAHSDYVDPDATQFEILDVAVVNRYGYDSPEYEAWFPLYRGSLAVTPHMGTPFYGVNSAFSLERAAVSWRDPETLEWQDVQLFTPPSEVLASDVPAWFGVKKKTERLYHSGGGRGDQVRLISQISTVAITDRAHYDAIETEMVDILAWIQDLEAPPYPGSIDTTLADEGQALFEGACSTCHGTYGEDWTYPNRLVATDDVGTDPVYASDFLDPPAFIDWLQSSSLTEAPYAADFDPEVGYVAPPLDGVWMTGPYLHNGSVPDLVALLDSSKRPDAWRRDFTTDDYDLDRLGPVWTEDHTGTGDPSVYDTTLRSFGNGGHTYGDALSESERSAVLEYLKTL